MDVVDDLGVVLELESLFPGIPAFDNRHSKLVTLAEELSGHPAQSVAFGTEGPFLQALGMDTIVMGPGAIDQAHQPDEYLAMDQIKPSVAVLQQLIARCCL